MISKSRNVIQNGNFDVWQRGTSFAAATTWVADRWKYDSGTEGVVTITQDTDVPNACSLYSTKIDVTTADGTIGNGQYAVLQQGIEGTFFQAVKAKPMVLSFWVKSYQTGIFCVAINDTAYGGWDPRETFLAEYTVNASATWEKKVIQVPPIPAGGVFGTGVNVACWLRFILACGSTYHGTAGWQGAYAFSTSNQTNLFSSTDNYIFLSQVQLEAGSSATEFEV